MLSLTVRDAERSEAEMVSTALFFPEPKHFLWQLCQQNSGEDEAAAENFSQAHGLTENEPATDEGEGRFQTHEHTGEHGADVLLSDYLQRVGYATGHDACVGHGRPACDEACERRRFKNEHQHAVDDGAGGELNERQAHAIKAFNDVFHADNLRCEAERADERI